MSISCTDLFEDVAQEIGSGIANDRLVASFPRAVNRALDELAVAADLATKYTHVSSTDGTVSMSASYEYILYAGVIFHLIRMGHRPVDTKMATIIYDDSRVNWDKAKADFVQDADNIRQTTATEDMIAWGALGTDTSSSDT